MEEERDLTCVNAIFAEVKKCTSRTLAARKKSKAGGEINTL